MNQKQKAGRIINLNAGRIGKILVFLVASLSLVYSIEMRGDIYEDYINSYADMAQAQQEEYGIPASIILAQGLLESSAGRSRLASEGNNHFGIKCHADWEGETMLRDDDRPNECFRVYSNAAESYRDHSLFLKRPRYSSLYDLQITDYPGWARGLRECGYATDPNYADKLISIIERYALYTYDDPTLTNPEETVAFIRETLSSSHPVRRSNGLHYVVAFPGDTYASIAKEFGMSEKKLKEYNDSKEKKVKEWEEVYLEPKSDEAPEGARSATIGEGENMRSISQRYGIKLSVLKGLNKKAKDKPGTVLRLR